MPLLDSQSPATSHVNIPDCILSGAAKHSQLMSCCLASQFLGRALKIGQGELTGSLAFLLLTCSKGKAMASVACGALEHLLGRLKWVCFAGDRSGIGSQLMELLAFICARLQQWQLQCLVQWLHSLSLDLFASRCVRPLQRYLDKLANSQASAADLPHPPALASGFSIFLCCVQILSPSCPPAGDTAWYWP